MKAFLEKAGLKPDLAEVTLVPAIKVAVDGDAQEKSHKLIEMLEDLDDVQEVYTNSESE